MKYRLSYDTFVVRSVEFPEMFRITPCFSSGGSSNVVDIAHTGVIWGCSWVFFSISPFIACILLVAHNIVELQSERE